MLDQAPRYITLAWDSSSSCSCKCWKQLVWSFLTIVIRMAVCNSKLVFYFSRRIQWWEQIKLKSWLLLWFESAMQWGSEYWAYVVNEQHVSVLELFMKASSFTPQRFSHLRNGSALLLILTNESDMRCFSDTKKWQETTSWRCHKRLCQNEKSLSQRTVLINILRNLWILITVFCFNCNAE